LFSGGEFYQTWGDLLESVRTGRCAFERRRGKPLFEWLSEQPATADLFHQGWHEITTRVARETAEVYDFTGVSTITDVGGGYGILLATDARLYESSGLELTRCVPLASGFDIIEGPRV
jgi:O-methyltransferase domain